MASAIVANDAKDCKGKFASARNSELVDSDVVFRGMSSCEDSERASISQYFILPRKKGGFVLFSVVANLRAEEARKPAARGKEQGFQESRAGGGTVRNTGPPRLRAHWCPGRARSRQSRAGIDSAPPLEKKVMAIRA